MCGEFASIFSLEQIFTVIVVSVHNPSSYGQAELGIKTRGSEYEGFLEKDRSGDF